MKALVQEGRGSADVLQLRDVPVPQLTDRTVLVRMRAASVTALDWHLTRGNPAFSIIAKLRRVKIQPVRGIDLAGTVVAVGSAVTRFKPGDDVFGAAPASFAEYVRSREDRLMLKPADLPFEQAATLNNSGLAALQAVRAAQFRPGDRVLVHGAGGGIGTFTVQIARALGAEVTAVTGPLNVDLIRSIGASYVIDRTKEDFVRGAERYDVVIDIAATRPVSVMRRVLKPGGLFLQVGASKSGGFIGIFARAWGVKARSRLGQHVSAMSARFDLDDLKILLDLIGAGKLTPVIEKTYPLAEAREAVRYVGTGQARAKVVITSG